ncbi:MAG: hypothetical protein SFW66_10805 [Gammaproteobacteria bacterium]|nr:hypothetical protein [Gammaproteobacteria bacterium]
MKKTSDFYPSLGSSFQFAVPNDTLPLKELKIVAESQSLVCFASGWKSEKGNDYFGRVYFDVYDDVTGQPLTLEECALHEAISCDVEDYKPCLMKDTIIPRRGFFNGRERFLLSAFSFGAFLPQENNSGKPRKIGGVIFFVGSQPSVASRTEKDQLEFLDVHSPVLIKGFPSYENTQFKESWRRILEKVSFLNSNQSTHHLQM